MAEALTVVEKEKLAELEAIIERDLKAFYEVGLSLMKIRDDKLYKETFPNFQAYCKKKWGMDRARAYQLIAATEVQENLYKIFDKDTITESHMMPLRKLPPAEQVEAYQKAVDTAPKSGITAKHVKRVVKDMKKKQQEEKKKPEEEMVTEKPIKEAVEEITGKTKPPTDMATEAMEFAGMAISQLERIRPDDPMKKKAILSVVAWGTAQISNNN
jgi:hypothetical protein